MEYLKKAVKTPATGEDDTRARVESMLKDIESGGEARARHHAESLDGWTGDIVVSADEIARASESLAQRMKDDIAFAHEQVRAFAEAQLASVHEFETELHPGVTAGQKLIPVETAGCYIPGGRYAHIASAIMSIATARVAGVPQRHCLFARHAKKVACIRPSCTRRRSGRCGHDSQRSAAYRASRPWHSDCSRATRRTSSWDPGNRFVAEAKRILYRAGRVSISSPGRPRSRSSPTRPRIPTSSPATWWARPSTVRTRPHGW